MSVFSVTLPSGVEWIPNFVQSIDDEKCIGCGRCFKTCGRDVLSLMAMDDEGELIAIEDGDDDDEYEKKVMTVAHPENCVGCEACARNCSKKCISHAPAKA
jgi:Nif-specific ferredoxin III